MTTEDGQWRPVIGALAPTNVLTFDHVQDLLWTGSSNGRIESLFDTTLSRYTSYKGHMAGPVKDIIVDDKGILSLSDRSVHFANRRGVAQWALS